MHEPTRPRQFHDTSPALAGMCAIGFFVFLTAPKGQETPYFFSAGTFLYPVFFFSLLSFLSVRFEKHSFALPTAVIGATFFAYGWFEVVYSHLPDPKAWLTAGSVWMPLWRELCSYAGNRFLQILPIGFLALMLARKLKNQWRHRIRLGDSQATTKILGGNEPQTWKHVAGRLAVFLVIATLGFLFAKGWGEGGSDRVMIFSGRLAGGAVNSLMEELLFRGILQPVFELALATGPANTLQAVFFSIIHFGYVESLNLSALAPELAKLFLYTGIGLFLGRAARETDGLLVPWLFHFLITSAIWVLLTVQGT